MLQRPINTLGIGIIWCPYYIHTIAESTIVGQISTAEVVVLKHARGVFDLRIRELLWQSDATAELIGLDVSIAKGEY